MSGWETSFAWIFIVKTCFPANIMFQNYSLMLFLFYRTLLPKSSWSDFQISEVLWRPIHPREHVWLKYRLLQWQVTMMQIPVHQQFIYHHLQDQAPHGKKITAFMKHVCTLITFTRKCTSIVFAVHNNII